jgi:hypothetical protein
MCRTAKPERGPPANQPGPPFGLEYVVPKARPPIVE